jgi:hypothetical protein
MTFKAKASEIHYLQQLYSGVRLDESLAIARHKTFLLHADQFRRTALLPDCPPRLSSPTVPPPFAALALFPRRQSLISNGCSPFADLAHIDSTALVRGSLLVQSSAERIANRKAIIRMELADNSMSARFPCDCQFRVQTDAFVNERLLLITDYDNSRFYS